MSQSYSTNQTNRYREKSISRFSVNAFKRAQSKAQSAFHMLKRKIYSERAINVWLQGRVRCEKGFKTRQKASIQILFIHSTFFQSLNLQRFYSLLCDSKLNPSSNLPTSLDLFPPELLNLNEMHN